MSNWNVRSCVMAERCAIAGLYTFSRTATDTVDEG